MHIGFIGLGNMASAIIRGMAAGGGFASDTILGFNRSPEKTERLKAECGITACQSVSELAARSDVIVLAVKPQVLPAVMGDVARHAVGRLVLTIAAGKTLAWYAERLPEGTAVIRTMPNINASVGESLTSLCFNSFVNDAQKALTARIFSSVGRVYAVEERLFPAFSAVCGASGAFVQLYIDALAEAGVRAGFPRALAEELAVGTVLGSAALTNQTGDHPIAVMNRICSPGGTTIEGVLKLKELGFQTAVAKGIEAIIEKDARL